MKKCFFAFLCLGAVLSLPAGTGCVSTEERVFGTSEISREALFRMQARLYDTDDADKVLRSALRVLQDFGFILEQTDPDLCFISGTAYPSGVRISVLVYKRRKTPDVLVRINLQYQYDFLTDEQIYQRFFEALSAAIGKDARVLPEKKETPPSPHRSDTSPGLTGKGYGGPEQD